MGEINSIDNLTGWRSLSLEEQSVQGLLYNEIKSTGTASKVGGVFLLVMSYVFFDLTHMVVVGFYKDISEGYYNDLVMFILCLLIFSALALLSLFFGIKILFSKEFRVNKKAILENNIRVLDIEMIHISTIHMSSGVDGHVVQVKDLQGNLCGKNITLHCRNGYKLTKGILIEVSNSNINSRIKDELCVVPCRTYDEKLWKACNKYYHKYHLDKK